MSDTKALCDAIGEAGTSLACESSPLPLWKAEIVSREDEYHYARSMTDCCHDGLSTTPFERHFNATLTPFDAM